MKIFSQGEIDKVVKFLKSGSVVAVPTETVYGLAIKFDNKTAIEKLIALKDRNYESNKVFTLMLPESANITEFAVVDSESMKLIQQNFPGELTIILPKNPEFSNEYFDNFQTIGIRIPKHEYMLNLLSKVGPLIVTSANKKGSKPALDSDVVMRELSEIEAVVQGEAGNQPPSTVVDFTTKQPVILRQGRVEL